MAQIDLKYAQMAIQDGYGATGAVNLTGGYTANATTMVVDGFTVALNDNDTFTVAGDTSETVYTISGHTETTGHTTSITFTPGLGASVADNAVITVLPHEVLIHIGEGNCQYTETRTIVYKRDYGRLRYSMLGDEEPLDMNFDFVWEFLSSPAGQPPTVKEALTQKGNASSWVTTDTDACQPYAVNIILTYNPPCGNTDSETIIFENYRYETLEHDLKEGTVAVKGKCLSLTTTDTRSTNVALPEFNDNVE